jgi:hypothetical protein
MTGYVFISYSHADAAYVDELVDYLAQCGIPVWIDHRVRLGDRWTFEIDTRIRSCGVFVPVMSAKSADSAWVDREIDCAQELRKPIAPLALDGTTPIRLRGLQHEDVRDGRMPGADFIGGLRAHLVGSPPLESVPAVRGPGSRPGKAGWPVVRRSTIRMLCALCVLLYAILFTLIMIDGDGMPSVPALVCGFAGLAAGVAAWVLALVRAARLHHRVWLAVIGFTTAAAALPGFLATVAYAIAGPADATVPYGPIQPDSEV